MKAGLRQEDIEGQTYWFQPASAGQHDGLPAVYLLPGFDEYYLGYTDRSLLLDAKYERRAVSSNGIFRPMIIIDGLVAGIWKREIKKGMLVLKPQPFERLTEAQERALRAAIISYGEFLGLPVELA